MPTHRPWSCLRRPAPAPRCARVCWKTRAINWVTRTLSRPSRVELTPAMQVFPLDPSSAHFQGGSPATALFIVQILVFSLKRKPLPVLDFMASLCAEGNETGVFNAYGSTEFPGGYGCPLDRIPTFSNDSRLEFECLCLKRPPSPLCTLQASASMEKSPPTSSSSCLMRPSWATAALTRRGRAEVHVRTHPHIHAHTCSLTDARTHT